MQNGTIVTAQISNGAVRSTGSAEATLSLSQPGQAHLLANLLLIHSSFNSCLYMYRELRARTGRSSCKPSTSSTSVQQAAILRARLRHVAASLTASNILTAPGSAPEDCDLVRQCSTHWLRMG